MNLGSRFEQSFCRPLRGLGLFTARDPRVTLPSLAHPGLPSVVAPRLVAADIRVDCLSSWPYHFGATQQIVGRERRERVSHHNWSGRCLNEFAPPRQL